MLVLDASAVIALLQDEPGALEVRAELEDARASNSRHLMTTVNWSEVLYTAARRLGHDDVAPTIGVLDQLPIGVVDARRGLAAHAVGLKLGYGVGLADAYAASLTILLDIALMTADAEFEALEGEGLRVRRIR